MTFVEGRPICFFFFFSLGIPGICVLLGVNPFLNCSLVGMPGMGLLPMGTLTAFTEIPGGKFAEGGNGLAERPGGIFAGSSLITPFAMELEFELVFDGPLEPQPKPEKMTAKQSKRAAFLNIL